MWGCCVVHVSPGEDVQNKMTILFNDSSQEPTNRLHATLLITFIHTEGQPIGDLQGCIRCVTLGSLTELLVLAFWDDFQDDIGRFPITVGTRLEKFLRVVRCKPSLELSKFLWRSLGIGKGHLV